MIPHVLLVATYTHPTQAGYLRPHEGHDPITQLGPTAEALAALETKPARLVIRTGDPRQGMPTYLVLR
jgi:hypothetical protein